MREIFRISDEVEDIKYNNNEENIFIRLKNLYS